MEMDPEAALELKKRSSLLREHGIGKAAEKKIKEKISHVKNIVKDVFLAHYILQLLITDNCDKCYESYFFFKSQQVYCSTRLHIAFKTVVEDTVTKAKINLSDVADTLKGDWVILATQLDISGDEIHKINSDYRTVNDQALAMLSLWKEKKGEQATGQQLLFTLMVKTDTFLEVILTIKSLA